MKKTHIVLLVLVAAAISVIVMSFGEFSTYETFASAAKEPGKTYHVIGYLETDREMEYDPLKDPNYFSFYVKDKADNIHKVIFNGTKPTDIERSENVVMTGYMQDGIFYCSKIQMKCPSKYTNDQIAEATDYQG